MHSESYDPTPYKVYPYAYVPIALRRCRFRDMARRLLNVTSSGVSGGTLHFSNRHMPTREALNLLNDYLKDCRDRVHGRSCTTVSTLIFEGERFTAKSLKAIVEGVCASSIQTLKMRGTSIGDVGMIYLNEILERCKTLTHVDITSSRVTNVGVECISQGLFQSTLKELVVKGNSLRSEGAHVIMSSIPSCLTLLDMRSCGIGNPGAEYVGMWLEKRDVNIEVLRLAYNSIGPRYTVSVNANADSYVFTAPCTLVDGLLEHKKVRWLDMEGNALYEECYEFTRLAKGTDLQRLYIGGTVPVNDVLQEMIEALTVSDSRILVLSLKGCQLGYHKAIDRNASRIDDVVKIPTLDVRDVEDSDDDMDVTALLTHCSRFTLIAQMLSNSKLVSCDLSFNVLRRCDLEYLHQLIKEGRFRDLRYLNLSGNFNFQGTGDIISDIVARTSLVSLSLDSCDLGDNDVVAIASAVETSAIRCLGLADNPFGADGMAALSMCASNPNSTLEVVDVGEVFGYTITNPYSFFKSLATLKANTLSRANSF